MDIKKKTGVNYDYVLALMKDGKGVKVVKYPIDRHDYEIDKAIERYYNESCDADDIYYAVSSCLHHKTYLYCLDHEYTDSYIDDILPVKFNPIDYRERLQEILKIEIESYLRRFKKGNKVDTNELQKIGQEVRKRNYYNIKKTKRILLDKVLPYIYALDYDDALNGNNIKKDCIVYSSEMHGDGRDEQLIGYHVEHKVNKDISIKLMTNFCYGSSTYFNVVVTYKGIELLPYSLWVKYYYAGYAQLLRYTRSYERRRESWHHCMNFLESFINSAIDNPELFIRNEVLAEIYKLVEGLERIMSLDDKTFEQEFKVRNNTGDTRYIGVIGVRDANEYDAELYHIAPEETAMIYKMEKITGALRFLDSLRKFEEFYDEISNSINSIIQMNVSLLPEIIKAMTLIKKDIEKLEKQLKRLKNELDFPLYWYNYYKRQLEHELSVVSLTQDREEVVERFKRRKPKYIMWKNDVETLKSQISSTELMFNERVKVFKRLRGFETLVKMYAL